MLLLIFRVSKAKIEEKYGVLPFNKIKTVTALERNDLFQSRWIENYDFRRVEEVFSESSILIESVFDF